MQNNMRDKLIELIADYTENVTARDLHSAEFDNKFADYLLENGVIVPPCKVGDTVYMICWDDGIEPFIEEDKIIKVSTQKFWLKYCYFNYDDIGKTVFLTRDEAERALRESEKIKDD